MVLVLTLPRGFYKIVSSGTAAHAISVGTNVLKALVTD